MAQCAANMHGKNIMQMQILTCTKSYLHNWPTNSLTTYLRKTNDNNLPTFNLLLYKVHHKNAISRKKHQYIHKCFGHLNAIFRVQ